MRSHEGRDMIHEVWAGPVDAAQIKGAEIPGAMMHFIPCTGDGKPTCGEMAEAWKDSDGRVLPGLLKSIKAEVAPGDELYAGAFSAGGQIWKRAMLDARDRAEITGALMADGGYEAGWIDEKAKIAPPVEGFTLYALDAINDGRLFVWTASAQANPSQLHPGTVYPAGDQVQEATRLEIEKRSGQKFQDVTGQPDLWPWGAHLRAPVKVWRLRNVLFVDYGPVYRHPEHATIVAPELWKAIPDIMASGTLPEAGGTWWSRLGPWAKGGLVVGGAAAVVFGGRAAIRRMR